MNAELEETFLRGVELFNRRRYFESHEAWEPLVPGLEGEPKVVVRALVQVAAGLHLRFEHGRARGARSLLRQALVALDGCTGVDVPIDVDRLRGEITEYAERLKEPGASDPRWIDRWLAPRLRRS